MILVLKQLDTSQYFFIRFLPQKIVCFRTLFYFLQKSLNMPTRVVFFPLEYQMDIKNDTAVTLTFKLGCFSLVLL